MGKKSRDPFYRTDGELFDSAAGGCLLAMVALPFLAVLGLLRRRA